MSGVTHDRQCILNLMRAIALVLCAAVSCYGWNSTGHRLVAAIAYDRLTPEVRARVDALLECHPDYGMLTRGASGDPKSKARAAFLAASVWPDVIKGDPRFWDDGRSDSQPTPPLPGFPDMKQHRNWHYKNLPFSPDGTALAPQLPPNAETEMDRIVSTLHSNGSGKPEQAAYDLPWLIHIVGDLHQPLHCVSRYTHDLPKGDAGGNNVWVAGAAGGQRLHAYWDDLFGRDDSEVHMTALEDQVASEHHKPRRVRTNSERWLKEGLKLAGHDVYTFGNANGTKENPVTLPPGYGERAQKLAHERVAIGGYRLAAILNDRLR